MQTNAKFKDAYVDFMQEYVALGHMAKQCENNERCEYFLPHHGIIKESSQTTMLRVVFDASCPTTTGYSLNGLQAAGPTIQSDLFEILVRFRQHLIAITGDIEKMYRQVLINESDCVFQKIYWREQPSKPLKIYVLKTVTYGTKSASFLAIRCLHEAAERGAVKYEKAAETIKEDFYVDDLLTGASTAEEAVELVTQITGILNDSCLPLRKFVSNNPFIFEKMRELKYHDHGIMNLGENENSKTLGLFWDPREYKLRFQIARFEEKRTLTKREVLAAVGQIFDPLGLIGACIVRAKIYLRTLWLKKLDWDDKIVGELKEEWIEFRKDLVALNELRIPRCVVVPEVVDLQLHGFADSSEKAYGASIYMRCELRSGVMITRLIASKSRVAPVKVQTTPRLELCAALLLAKLMKKISDCLRLTINKTFMWSDSTTVLSWFKTSPHRLKIFVGNRIMQIIEISHDATWRHVPSKENPADILSRGVTAACLLGNVMRWNGPSWLAQQPSEWPVSIIANTTQEDMRPISINCMLARNVELSDISERFGCYTKARRICALILRFVNNCRRKEPPGRDISVENLRSAEMVLIRAGQSAVFRVEIQALEKECALQKDSKIRALSPFLDDTKILRVGGGLKFSYLSYEERHPIILPTNAHLTRLLFKYEHLRLGHAGPNQILFSIRERFWAVNGRNVAKRTVHKCIRCFKAKPRNSTPIMGQLPEPRVKPSYPFQVTGVDYAGPFRMKRHKGRGSKIEKGYLAIFVCFAVKAIHIEVVSDLTTEAFLAALKRFISRRGMPKEMQSDNGTNFVGAANELRSVLKTLKEDCAEISDFLGERGIKWSFILASAPHFGGIWESNVKRMKFHIKRIIGDISLTYEAFATLTCQIEAIMNSRLLSPLSSHPDDIQPLTPGHFLIGRTLTAIPEANLENVNSGKLKDYQHVQQLVQHFWSRWSREYLPELQVKEKWKYCSKPLNVGDLVLIKNEATPPLCWRLGRVIELHPGKDNTPRVATVKTGRGNFRRPVVKLFPLPLETSLKA